jgi:hypothetical protein
MKSPALSAVILLAALVLVGITTGSPAPQAKMIVLDQKVDNNTWVNREGTLYLTVNVFLTRGADKQAYIPLEIGVANPSGKTVTLTRDSFILVDQDGNTYPMTPPKEIMKKYGRVNFDRSKSALSHTTTPVFNGFNFVRSQFEPNPRMTPGTSNVITDQVEIPTSFAIADLIYFQMPAKGLKGTYFELRVTAAGLEEPQTIKFAIDLPKVPKE